MVDFGTTFAVEDYDLGATLDSGQAFRWEPRGEAWEGVVGRRWVRLTQIPGGIEARTSTHPGDWSWLRRYLQVDLHLPTVLASFPDEAPLRAAARACRGLRLLRQEPWECLASFLLSSTKQILQIRQIVRHLCQRFGNPVSAPPGRGDIRAFPAPSTLAAATDEDLRACRMGFRARYLRSAARTVAEGSLVLEELEGLPLADARARLMELEGVGPKIADCVLLFAHGFSTAFPVDVWVMRALQDLYFPGSKQRPARLLEFSASHFGAYGGYAQQYLFHYMRLKAGRVARGQPVEEFARHAGFLPGEVAPMVSSA